MPLPQGLINVIIDNIPEDCSEATQKTLLACTQVSRSFRRPARKRLFSTINLALGTIGPIDLASPEQSLNVEDGAPAGKGLRSARQFLQLQGGDLDDSPRAASERLTFVRKLHLHLRSTTATDGLFDEFSTALEAIYHGAFNLKTLWMTSFQTGAWVGLVPNFPSKFIRLLTASGRIKYLRINGMKSVQRDLLMVCPALRVLEVNNIQLGDPRYSLAQPNTVEKMRHPLESLFVDQPFGPFFPMLSYVSRDFKLKKFRTRLLHKQCVDAVHTLLHQSSRELTSLDLTFMDRAYRYQLSQAPIQLDLLPALNSIRLSFAMKIPNDADIPHPTRILETLTTSTIPSQIESIELCYRCLLSKNTVDTVSGPPTTHSSLRTQHPHLKRLHLRYDILYAHMAAYPKHPSGLPAFEDSVFRQINSAVDSSSLNPQEFEDANGYPADVVDLKVQVYDYRAPAFFRLWDMDS